MKSEVAVLCVAAALFLDTLSYWWQIRKIMRTKRSAQVSSTAFLYKIAKVVFSMVGLAIYRNFVGVGMEMFMLCVYVTSLYVIAAHKPKGWSLFQ